VNPVRATPTCSSYQFCTYWLAGLSSRCIVSRILIPVHCRGSSLVRQRTRQLEALCASQTTGWTSRPRWSTTRRAIIWYKSQVS